MLKSLELTNFRNYEKFALEFARTTILIGKNGVGKTNIIESICLISTGRSWRTKRDSEVVNWNSEVSRIEAAAAFDEKSKIELAIQKNPSKDYPQTKILKINNVKKRLTDLLGTVPTVLFSPEEISLVDGAPVLRRRFLDVLLCQIDRKYTLALLDLTKIIRGRNKLLYYIKIGKSKTNELDFWDEKLVVLGSYIMKKRQGMIEKINLNLPKIYSEIAGEDEKLTLRYRKSVEIEEFAEVLGGNREREIENTATLFGPHRDDLAFMLENKDISTFGSRGEYRSAVSASKVAELEFLAKEKGIRPILLLDDIFSELDANRRLHLAKIVKGQQTIITTTELDHIEKGLRDSAKIVELR